MIDMDPMQQIPSRCVNEESYLGFRAWWQQPNLTSQVQRERVPGLCV